MTMFERIINEHIFLDFSVEPLYGSDQMYMDYPVRFATVHLGLMDTDLLTSIVDRMRKEEGFAPFHPMDEYMEKLCDHDGFYDFCIGLNEWDSSRIDTCIEAVVCNSRSADEGEMYTIDLSPEEQGLLFCRLDEQCRKYLGKGCVDLLAESHREMEGGS